MKLTWLEGKPTTAAVTTWGTPWPKGAVPANQSFALQSADGSAAAIGLGTDWSGLAAAWLTEWERQGPKADVAHAKLLGTMETIGAMPNGFVTGGGLYDLDTGRFAPVTEKTVSVSHLSAMFGQVEICAELIDLVDLPAFEAAWLQYCRLFNATREEQTSECGAYVDSTLNPTKAAKWVSTNTTALYGLAAIQTLALVGDQIVNP
ncbi:hypothetical protein AB0E63_29465 [Kribbella sp. NPDC026596]|uniref:exo-rhamnogalacturonan lyase family protein n=1 Tax=Kribbella sp. NPDC026596 TaxID=3155122 RepID=UPI0033E30154